MPAKRGRPHTPAQPLPTASRRKSHRARRPLNRRLGTGAKAGGLPQALQRDRLATSGQHSQPSQRMQPIPMQTANAKQPCCAASPRPSVGLGRAAPNAISGLDMACDVRQALGPGDDTTTHPDPAADMEVDDPSVPNDQPLESSAKGPTGMLPGAHDQQAGKKRGRVANLEAASSCGCDGPSKRLKSGSGLVSQPQSGPQHPTHGSGLGAQILTGTHTVREAGAKGPAAKKQLPPRQLGVKDAGIRKQCQPVKKGPVAGNPAVASSSAGQGPSKPLKSADPKAFDQPQPRAQQPADMPDMGPFVFMIVREAAAKPSAAHRRAAPLQRCRAAKPAQGRCPAFKSLANFVKPLGANAANPSHIEPGAKLPCGSTQHAAPGADRTACNVGRRAATSGMHHPRGQAAPAADGGGPAADGGVPAAAPKQQPSKAADYRSIHAKVESRRVKGKATEPAASQHAAAGAEGTAHVCAAQKAPAKPPPKGRVQKRPVWRP